MMNVPTPFRQARPLLNPSSANNANANTTTSSSTLDTANPNNDDDNDKKLARNASVRPQASQHPPPPPPPDATSNSREQYEQSLLRVFFRSLELASEAESRGNEAQARAQHDAAAAVQRQIIQAQPEQQQQQQQQRALPLQQQQQAPTQGTGTGIGFGFGFAMNGTGPPMQGGGGPGGGAMVGPTPAGHQAELNFIWGLVDELSRQLADSRRATESLIAGVGRVRNRARELGLTNEDVLREAAEELAAQETNLETHLSNLQESLDKARHGRDANFNLLTNYARVMAALLTQFHTYKQKHVADVSAWHRSYRSQLAEARAENARLREQIWDMQAHAGQANALLREFRKKYDEDESRAERRVAERARRQELRFWKRMALPDVDESTWSDDDDLVDPVEKERLLEVERKVAEQALAGLGGSESGREDGDGSESESEGESEGEGSDDGQAPAGSAAMGRLANIPMARKAAAGLMGVPTPPPRPSSAGSTGSSGGQANEAEESTSTT